MKKYLAIACFAVLVASLEQPALGRCRLRLFRCQRTRQVPVAQPVSTTGRKFCVDMKVMETCDENGVCTCVYDCIVCDTGDPPEQTMYTTDECELGQEPCDTSTCRQSFRFRDPEWPHEIKDKVQDIGAPLNGQVKIMGTLLEEQDIKYRTGLNWRFARLYIFQLGDGTEAGIALPISRDKAINPEEVHFHGNNKKVDTIKRPKTTKKHTYKALRAM